MMDELVLLANAAAAAIATAAATDAWTPARAAVVRLFGRTGRRRQELVAARLDADAHALASSPAAERPALRDRMAVSWQARLTDLLDEHPEAAGELRALFATGPAPVAHHTGPATTVGGGIANSGVMGNVTTGGAG